MRNAMADFFFPCGFPPLDSSMIFPNHVHATNQPYTSVSELGSLLRFLTPRWGSTYKLRLLSDCSGFVRVRNPRAWVRNSGISENQRFGKSNLMGWSLWHAEFFMVYGRLPGRGVVVVGGVNCYAGTKSWIYFVGEQRGISIPPLPYFDDRNSIPTPISALSPLHKQTHRFIAFRFATARTQKRKPTGGQPGARTLNIKTWTRESDWKKTGQVTQNGSAIHNPSHVPKKISRKLGRAMETTIPLRQKYKKKRQRR